MKAFFETILYQPLYNLLIFLAWLVPGHSIGWAIILLTIIIRTLLLPTSIKAARAMAKLSLLQPEMNRIRKEIKDQKAQGRALMELYKKEGVSPFGSCLPLLIQLPILIILYQVFRAGVDPGSFNLLYAFTPHPDIVNPHFLWFNLASTDKWILPLLAGGSQFILSKMMMPPIPAIDPNKKAGDAMTMATQAMNKQMIYLFPFITIVFARSLPAALSLYWIVTTVFGIFQQMYVNESIRSDPKVRKEVLEDAREVEEEFHVEPAKALPKENKKSNLLERMMEKRLDKQEKKTGVEVTIRQKK